MKRKFTNRCIRQQGFTLVEMLIATVILLVGLVAVAQLVPISVLMNSNNRNDGTALVFAQWQMEALREQPLANTTFTDPAGVTCPLGNTCNLGDPTQQPRLVVGSPVVTNSAGDPIIDFGATPVPGYSFTYLDPNDPFGATYDVRWAVITIVNSQSVVTGKRIIVGVFRRGMQNPSLPITLDTMVEK
ncbi:MAG: prepilin-type N-terminal cleavage/methylation domain-containing protein [Candidatus Acidiferrum sp.]